MRVTLIWPIGNHQPSEVIDVAPQLGQVLVREGFARPSVGDPIPPEPAPPTVAELKAFAAEHGLTLTEARRRMADDLAARREGAVG